MTETQTKKDLYREALMQLPEAGINLRTTGGMGSHIGPIYVAKAQEETSPYLLAPMRDERDECRLLIEPTNEVATIEAGDNRTLVALPNGQRFEVFDRYIDVITAEEQTWFAHTRWREDFYLRSWNSPDTELTFPEDPKS